MSIASITKQSTASCLSLRSAIIRLGLNKALCRKSTSSDDDSDAESEEESLELQLQKGPCRCQTH